MSRYIGSEVAIMVMVKHFFFSDSAAYDKLRRELESEFEADDVHHIRRTDIIPAHPELQRFFERLVILQLRNLFRAGRDFRH